MSRSIYKIRMRICIPEQNLRAMHSDKTSDDLYQLCCRLKTRRQKKRLVHKDRDKKLLRLDRETNRIQKQINALGWEDLEEPVQRGWKRTFVLREDVARSSKAMFYQQILDKINTVQWCKRKDFLVKRWGEKNYRPIRIQPTEIPVEQVGKSGLTENELKLFIVKEIYDRKVHMCFSFSEPWRFAIKVFPNMITQRKIGSAQLDSELKEKEQYLDCRNLYPRIIKLKYGNTYKPNRWDKKWEDPRWKNPLKNKPLHQIINAAEEDGL